MSDNELHQLDSNEEDRMLDDLFNDDYDPQGFDKGSRDPIQSFYKGTRKELKETFTDSSKIEDLLEKTLPDEYAEALSVFNSTTSAIEDVVDASKNDFRYKAKEILTSTEKILPNKATSLKERISKLNESITIDDEDDGPIGISEEEELKQRRKEELSSALAKLARKEENRDIVTSAATSASVDNLTLSTVKGNQAILTALSALSRSTERTASFHEQITNSYYRKSLELQYRQLFTQIDTYKLSRSHFKEIELIMNKVQHNTGLPEFKKITQSERFAELSQTKFMMAAQDSLFGNAEFIKKGIENLKDKLGSKIDTIKNTASLVAQGKEAIGDEDPYEEAGKSFSKSLGVVLGKLFKGPTEEERLEALRDRAEREDPTSIWGKLYRKVTDEYHKRNDVFEENTSELRARVREIGQELGRNTASLEDVLNRTASSERLEDSMGDGFAKRFGKAAARNILSAFGEATDVNFEDRDIEDEFGAFAKRDKTTLNQVIPTLLSKIYDVTRAIHEGSDQVTETVYDRRDGKIKSREARGAEVRERFTGEAVASSYRGALEELHKKIDDLGDFDEVTSKEVKRKLSEIGFNDVLSNGLSAVNIDTLLNEKFYTPEEEDLSNKIREVLKDRLDDDKKLKGELNDELIRLRKNIRDVRGEMDEYRLEYGSDGLVDSGLITVDSNGSQSLNLDAYRRYLLGESVLQSTESERSEDTSTREETREHDPERSQRSVVDYTTLLTSIDQSLTVLTGRSVTDYSSPLTTLNDTVKTIAEKPTPDYTDAFTRITELLEEVSRKQPIDYSDKLDSTNALLTRLYERPTPSLTESLSETNALLESQVSRPDYDYSYHKQTNKLLSGIKEQLSNNGTDLQPILDGMASHRDSLIETHTLLHDKQLEVQGSLQSVVREMGETLLDCCQEQLNRLGTSKSQPTVEETYDTTSVETGDYKPIDLVELLSKRPEEIDPELLKRIDEQRYELVEETYTDGNEKVKGSLIESKLPAGYDLIYKAGSFTVGKVAGKTVSAIYRPRDVYKKGSPYPAMTAVDMRNGLYRDRESGEVINTLRDIKGDVVNTDGDLVLTDTDIRNGLYDKNARRITLPFSTLMRISRRLAGFVGKGVGRSTSLLWNVATFSPLRRRRDRTRPNVEGVEGDNGSLRRGQVNAPRVVEVNDPTIDKIPTKLDKLINVIKERIPDPRRAFNDHDGDGVREGSWRNLFKRKERREESGRGDVTNITTTEEKKGKGWLLSLLGGAGVATLIGLKKIKEFFSGSLMDMLKGVTEVATKSVTTVGGGILKLLVPAGATAAAVGLGQRLINSIRGLGNRTSNTYDQVANNAPRLLNAQGIAGSLSRLGASVMGTIGGWLGLTGDSNGNRSNTPAGQNQTTQTQPSQTPQNQTTQALNDARDTLSNVERPSQDGRRGDGRDTRDNRNPLTEEDQDRRGRGRGRGGLLRRAGRGLLNFGKSMFGLNGGTGMAASAGRAAGLARAGLIAGSVMSGAGGLGAVVATASTVLASPVVLGAATLAAVGYGGYKLYKHLNRNNVTGFDKLRLLQYGYSDGMEDHYYTVLRLEEAMQDNCISYKDGVATIDEKTVPVEEIFEIFDIRASDSTLVAPFLTWFDKRFKPVFIRHLTVLYGLNSSLKLKEIDKLGGDQKLTYLKRALFETGPYHINVSPLHYYKELSVKWEHVKAHGESLKTQLSNEDEKQSPGTGPGSASTTIKEGEKEQVADVYSKEKDEGGQNVPKGVDKLIAMPPAPEGLFKGIDASNAQPRMPDKPVGVPYIDQSFQGKSEAYVPASSGHENYLTYRVHSPQQTASSQPLPEAPATKGYTVVEAKAEDVPQENYTLNTNVAPTKKNMLEIIRKAALKVGGVDPTFAQTVAAIESSLNPKAKAKTTSASGLFQFVKDTWFEQVKKHGKKYGITNRTNRFDPMANSLLGVEYIKSNLAALKKVKSSPNATDAYLAHFLGAGGARTLLRHLAKNPNTKGNAILSRAAKSNKSIFYKKGRARTVQEIYDLMTNKVKKRAAEYGIPFNASGGITRSGSSDGESTKGEVVKSSPVMDVTFNKDGVSPPTPLPANGGLTGAGGSANTQGGVPTTPASFMGTSQQTFGTNSATTPNVEGSGSADKLFGGGADSPEITGKGDGGGTQGSSVVGHGGALKDGSGGMKYIKKQRSSIRFKGLNPQLWKQFLGMAEEYGEKTGKSIQVNDGFRTRAMQEALFKKYGPGRAAKPGHSRHETGLAIDIQSATAAKLEKLGLMKKYGFTRPVGQEPWHLEPAGIQLDPKRSKSDPEYASKMIAASAGRGGGGYGMKKNARKYGRDVSLAKSLFEAGTPIKPSKPASPTNLDKTEKTALNKAGITPPKPAIGGGGEAPSKDQTMAKLAEANKVVTGGTTTSGVEYGRDGKPLPPLPPGTVKTNNPWPMPSATKAAPTPAPIVATPPVIDNLSNSDAVASVDSEPKPKSTPTTVPKQNSNVQSVLSGLNPYQSKEFSPTAEIGTNTANMAKTLSSSDVTLREIKSLLNQYLKQNKPLNTGDKVEELKQEESIVKPLQSKNPTSVPLPTITESKPLPVNMERSI